MWHLRILSMSSILGNSQEPRLIWVVGGRALAQPQNTVSITESHPLYVWKMILSLDQKKGMSSVTGRRSPGPSKISTIFARTGFGTLSVVLFPILASSLHLESVSGSRLSPRASSLWVQCPAAKAMKPFTVMSFRLTHTETVVPISKSNICKNICDKSNIQTFNPWDHENLTVLIDLLIEGSLIRRTAFHRTSVYFIHNYILRFCDE